MNARKYNFTYTINVYRGKQLKLEKIEHNLQLQKYRTISAIKLRSAYMDQLYCMKYTG